MEFLNLASLQYYLAIIKKRWVPASIILTVVTLLGLLSVFLRKPIYNAEGTLRFERTSPMPSLTGVGKESSSLEPLEEKSSPLSTETEVIRSFPIVQATISKMDLREGTQNTPLKYKDFLKQLTIVSVKQADILRVSYKDPDPDKATKVVNTLISSYLDSNLLAHRTRASSAREFIEQQLPRAEIRVKQAEDNLKRFKVKNNVVALKEETRTSVDTTRDIRREINDAQTQLQDAEAQAAELNAKLGIKSEQAVVSAALSQSAGVQEVLSQIQQIETELVNKRTRLQAGNPEILNLQDRLAQMKRLLQKRIGKIPGSQFLETQRHLQMGTIQQDLTKEVVALNARSKGLRNQIDTLTSIQQQQDQRTRLLPQLEAEQRELERKLDAAQATYSQLLQKIGEISVAEKQNVGNARVIASAQVPNIPIFPNQVSYLTPILLGLFSSGALIYGLEAFDKSVKTAEQAKQILGSPLLSAIPYAENAKQLPPYADSQNLEYQPSGVPLIQNYQPYTSSNVAYRVLHANLKFSSFERPPRTIVITSAVAQEGKSTVTANLALAIAQSNQRVLLVDADLYRPIQHQIWDTSNQIGLSNILAQPVNLTHEIVTVRPNLHLLPAGAIPNNSLALIDSGRMASLIDQVSASYDFVLIDTPPLTATTEALILGKMADGIVFVIRPSWVDQESAKYARSLLEQSNQNVLGHVVNDVAIKSNRSRYLSEYQPFTHS